MIISYILQMLNMRNHITYYIKIFIKLRHIFLSCGVYIVGSHKNANGGMLMIHTHHQILIFPILLLQKYIASFTLITSSNLVTSGRFIPPSMVLHLLQLLLISSFTMLMLQVAPSKSLLTPWAVPLVGKTSG